MGLLRAALTSGSLYVVGDLINQLVIKESHKANWEQTSRFLVVGATLHGPYFFYGFKILDYLFGHPKKVLPVVVKSLTGQFCVFPPFIILMLTYTGILDGISKEKIFAKVRENFYPIFTNGFFVWPISNFITFRFVPIAYRMIWINIVGIGWNSYLSWQINTRKHLSD